MGINDTLVRKPVERRAPDLFALQKWVTRRVREKYIAQLGTTDPSVSSFYVHADAEWLILDRIGVKNLAYVREQYWYHMEFQVNRIYGNRLCPGARELLRAVAATGGKAWIVTSKPEPQAVRVAALLKIETVIGGVVGAGLDEVDTKTELVGRALSAAAIPAGETLMLGDRHHDVTGARENGVLPIGALWGYGSRKELADAGCTRFVRTLAEYCTKYLMADAAEPRRRVAGG